MGALHAGHAALMKECAARDEVRVASIFVNPAQFAPHEDYGEYPRTFEDDCAMAESFGFDAIYAPTAETMYPPNYATYVEAPKLSERMCGVSRPHFFRGVATVVCKLFNAVQPTRAYFGKKDAQQLAIIRRMVRDLDMDVEIVPVDIVREADGFALSSRNTYLNADQRQQALSISRALNKGLSLIQNGERDAETVVSAVRSAMNGLDIDYVELVDQDEITPLTKIEGKVLLAVAAQVGKARLIDNVTYEVDEQ